MKTTTHAETSILIFIVKVLLTTASQEQLLSDEEMKPHDGVKLVKPTVHPHFMQEEGSTTGEAHDDYGVRSLIIGGDTVDDTSKYPFYAHPASSEFLRSICGATLIHEDVLLTAAHCVDILWQAGARVGGIDFDADGTLIDTESCLPHPDYDGDFHENDIMLIKLSKPSTAPLVALNTDPDYPPDNTPVTAIG